MGLFEGGLLRVYAYGSWIKKEEACIKSNFYSFGRVLAISYECRRNELNILRIIVIMMLFKNKHSHIMSWVLA